MPVTWFKSLAGPKVDDEVTRDETPDSTQDARADTKHAVAGVHGEAALDTEKIAEVPDKELTEGVQKVEAITQIWTKKSLIVVFCS